MVIFNDIKVWEALKMKFFNMSAMIAKFKRNLAVACVMN